MAALLPYGFAKQHGLLAQPEERQTPHITVYHRPEVTMAALIETRRVVDQPVRLSPLSLEQFNQRLRQFYEQNRGSSFEIADTIHEESDLLSIADCLAEPDDLLESDDDAPIIKLINALLMEAVRESASDIHIEPYESRLRIRFRIDGVLKEVLQPRLELAPLINSRIKIMSKLDISEKRLPQDGRISIYLGGHPVDIRVSTIPSGVGERIVMRLLDKQSGSLDLAHLGLPNNMQRAVEHLIQRPHGIILVTGPTGSGKTTTLYAALEQINESGRNIMTVEDPIEYYLDGISQTAVNSRVDMTFSKGLRSILRQDPDVIMVGEIRDHETAQISIQASLTGHLVFSTLHTNSAAGAITRLQDMGIEPFLLSSGIIGIVAQRLARLLCTHCKEHYSASSKECEYLNFEAPATLYRARGCSYCNQTGYSGRTGIYELVEINEHLRKLIHDSADQTSIEQEARRHALSLHQQGIRKVVDGDTSVEELVRISEER